MKSSFQANDGGENMRDVTVKYLLQDEEEERLRKITELYKKQGFDLPEDKMFEGIMCMGAKYDIDKKFKFHEWKLGLREDFMEE